MLKDCCARTLCSNGGDASRVGAIFSSLYTISPANFTLKPNTVANIISISLQKE